MIVRANIKQNSTLSVDLEKGIGQGAISPEDKAILENLANRPSLTQYFDDAKSNILYWNGETIGLENYENFYKVSDVTPEYEDLQDYTIYVTYREIESHSLMTSELSVIGDDSAGYCALGTVSSEPVATQIYAYVAYENNSLGISKGTYLNKGYEVSELDVGHLVYEKKVIKEDCLPESNVEAGTYGGFDSSVPAYNISNVTVDEYGRITEASNSVLPKASAESDGYIGADDYAKFIKAPIYCWVKTYTYDSSFALNSASAYGTEPLGILPTAQVWFYKASQDRYYPVNIKQITLDQYNKGNYYHQIHLDADEFIARTSIETCVAGDKCIYFSNISALNNI